MEQFLARQEDINIDMKQLYIQSQIQYEKEHDDAVKQDIRNKMKFKQTSNPDDQLNCVISTYNIPKNFNRPVILPDIDEWITSYNLQYDEDYLAILYVLRDWFLQIQASGCSINGIFQYESSIDPTQKHAYFTVTGTYKDIEKLVPLPFIKLIRLEYIISIAETKT